MISNNKVWVDLLRMDGAGVIFVINRVNLNLKISYKAIRVFSCSQCILGSTWGPLSKTKVSHLVQLSMRVSAVAGLGWISRTLALTHSISPI